MSDVSPIDLRGYIDLTLYDRDPGELVERSLLDSLVKMPGWQPREGDPALVLDEGLSLIVAELIYAVNRVPGAVAEGILRLQALDRDQGAGPTGTALVTFSDNLGRTVTAGTRVALALPDGTQVLFTFDADTSASPGQTTASGAITSATRTSSANGVGSPTGLQLLDQHFYVDSIALDSTITGGRDVEDTASWLSRAIQRFARLVDTIVLPSHFVAAALEEPGVFRAACVNLYDPTGGGVPGDDPGHVTVAVLGPNGVALSTGAKQDLYDRIRPLTADHLEVHIIDATITAVPIVVTVDRNTQFTEAEVKAAVETRLREYLSPDTWSFAGTVYRNELISVVDQVPGVNRVVSITTPAADQVLGGVAPLAKASTVTVNAP